MKELIHTVKSITSDIGGTWGIVLKDLSTHEEWALNKDEVFYSASVVKLPIMAAIYKASDEDKFQLHDEVTLREKELVGGAGVLQHMTPGFKISIQDLVTLMIIQSDNTATNMLIDLVGVSYIQDVMKEIGMTHSTFYHKLMISSSKRDGKNMTTARDNAIFLEKLYDGNIVSKKASSAMIDIMKKQQVSNCLPHQLPYQEMETDDEGSQWEIAHKTGWIPGIRHDVGIFYVDNKPFVASVFSKDINDLSSELAFSKVGKAIYNYLS